MSRGRHTLPPAPRSDVPLAILGLLLVAAAIGAVWWVDASLAVRVAATAAILLVALGALTSVRASRHTSANLWQDAAERRRELVRVQRELGELRTQQREMVLELRALRSELAASAEETVRTVQVATDQQELMRELLAPRQPVPDPVYPSMHVPLVRAAFAAEVPPADPPEAPSVSSGDTARGGSEESSGGEPFPPRELLDLTASEIAQLRPAN
jgi:hypothetical protein